MLGLDWAVEYREDATVAGALAVAARTRLYERWDVFARAQRDLDRNEWLAYVFGLRRNDHDWAISLNAIYNPFINETTFRIEFEPRFGGGPRRSNRLGGVDVRGGAFSY